MRRRRLNLLREFSLPLLLGVTCAVVWANAAPGRYEAAIHTPLLGGLNLRFLTNDIFMAFFFAIAAAEVTQSSLPGGDLNPPRRAVNALLATLGGVLGPAALYTALNRSFGAPALANGWGIPTATDVAIAWMAARLVFGRNHPAIAYLLLLAIADDAVGLAIIALFYPDPASPAAPLWLGLVGVGMAAAYLLRRFPVRSYWPYLALGGVPCWVGLHAAHLHPALALVFVVPFLPHPHREDKHFFDEDRRDSSTLARFEHEWKVVVDFGLFLFGLANAGVRFSQVGPETWLVLSSLLVGKTLGIFGFGLLGEALGFALPAGVDRKALLVLGMVAGIGFTVALFIAGEAFVDPRTQAEARMGAFLSLAVGGAAVISGKALGIRRVR